MSFFRQFPKTVYDFQDNGIDTNIVDMFRFVKVNDAFLDDLSIYTYYQVNDGARPDVVSNTLYGTPEYYWTFFIINEQLKTGLSGWPMTSLEFQAYMDEQYSGLIIETNPYIPKDLEGNPVLPIRYENSLAGTVPGENGSFLPGEIVRGGVVGPSAPTGIVVSKDTQLSQLLLRDVTGTFTTSQQVTGATSGASVVSAKVYEHLNAPHHYEDENGLEIYYKLSINEGTNPPGSVVAVTNYEYETQLNDERANIRVVRPDAVYSFAKKFRELINA